MSRRKRGFLVVTEEPQPIPQPNAEIIKEMRPADIEDARETVLSEISASGDSEDQLIDLLYKKLEKRNKLPDPVAFVSDIGALNIVIDVLRPDKKGEFVVQSTNIEFRRGRFETDDVYVAKAMRRHPSYGGKGDEVVTNSPEPLFWEENFPSWKWDMIASYESNLSPVPREE